MSEHELIRRRLHLGAQSSTRKDSSRLPPVNHSNAASSSEQPRQPAPPALVPLVVSPQQKHRLPQSTTPVEAEVPTALRGLLGHRYVMPMFGLSLDAHFLPG